jgi:hypothetical protein
MSTQINIATRLPYKVYTALLTQSGGDDIIYTSSGLLTIGVTYLINDLEDVVGADFTNVGAPNNDLGTYFIATGTTPNSWGTNPFGVAILQYNTGAPVATVLENTIGDIWFTYNNVGTYNIYSDSLFLIGKTITFTTTSSSPSDSYWITTQIGNSEEIYLFQFDASGSYYNNLRPTSLEIRIYN